MPSQGVHAALSPETLVSLRICLVLILLVHVPVLGAVLGGCAVSLVLNFIGRERKDRSYLRFSREVMEAVSIDWKVLLLLGLLPVPLLGLIQELAFSWRSPLPRSFWLAPAAFLAAAFLFVRRYHAAVAEREDAPGAGVLFGIAGFLAGTFALFLLWGGFGTVFNPEKAELLRERIGYFVSWSSVAKFHQFLALFPGMTAAVILLYVDRPALAKEDPGYGEIVRAWGRLLAWISAAAVPALGLLGLASLPELALSASVVAASAAVALLSLAVVMLLPPEKPRERAMGAPILGLFSLMLLALLAADQAALGNAFRGRVSAVVEVPAHAEATAPPKGKPAATAAAQREKGEEVFEAICAGCHRFDAKVVGPPLDEVLPKYAGDLEKLKGFVRSPVKVNPGYPAMPDLGLSEEQIDAVARYLLARKPGAGEGAKNPGGEAPAGRDR